MIQTLIEYILHNYIFLIFTYYVFVPWEYLYRLGLLHLPNKYVLVITTTRKFFTVLINTHASHPVCMSHICFLLIIKFNLKYLIKIYHIHMEFTLNLNLNFLLYYNILNKNSFNKYIFLNKYCFYYPKN